MAGNGGKGLARWKTGTEIRGRRTRDPSSESSKPSIADQIRRPSRADATQHHNEQKHAATAHGEYSLLAMINAMYSTFNKDWNHRFCSWRIY
jgi:hypothetical protein